MVKHLELNEKLKPIALLKTTVLFDWNWTVNAELAKLIGVELNLQLMKEWDMKPTSTELKLIVTNWIELK